MITIPSCFFAAILLIAFTVFFAGMLIEHDGLKSVGLVFIILALLILTAWGQGAKWQRGYTNQNYYLTPKP